MTKRMLIDAAHKEEVRVVVVNDDKVEDFEVETAGKEQIKGNIYVAEVTRVEPSLQAAFVNYGGNRNGFLAFSEIHPAYFSLNDEEKQALLDELDEIANKRKGRDQEAEKRLEDEAKKKEEAKKALKKLEEKDDAEKAEEAESSEVENTEEKEPVEVKSENAADQKSDADKKALKTVKDETPESLTGLTPEEMEEDAKALAIASSMVIDDQEAPVEDAPKEEKPKRRGRPARKPRRHTKKGESNEDTSEEVNTKGEETDVEAKTSKRSQKSDKNDNSKNLDNADDTEAEETTEERRQPIHRRYNIADVVKEGQKILIQVNKEERGNKGAAVSTYISLPGRYSVLMPNTPYAGGISRKITDFSVRRKIKSIVGGLDIPSQMGVIIRTAGVNQEEESIKKDVNNMLSLWKKIDKAYNSRKKAPFVVHEDGSLAVRAIRDMFNDEIEEVNVSDRKTYRATKDYMKSLMPESAKKVKEHKLQTPIFIHYEVEDKLNRLHTTRVNLPSGGYLIINPTEALVSIDVNSGKATQEKNIEETALKTNLEAAEEVARQLRLRDLAGLVVVDFIDMEENKNDKAVERMMRKCVRKDRARIQIAPISQFGLLEMSRQRLRPSLGESTMQPCKHCNGTGLVPSLASAALTLLRSLEDENIRTKAERVIVTTSDDLALYILNHKRELLKDIEERHNFDVYLRGDDKYHAPDHRIEIVHKDSRGNEKRQTIEVILREPMEEDDNNRSRRRGKKKPTKGKDNKQVKNKQDTDKKSDKKDHKPDNQNSEDKSESKSKNADKKSRRNTRRDRRDEKADETVEAKTENTSENAEHTKEDDNKRERRGGGRVRHLRRGTRRRRDESEGSTGDSKPVEGEKVEAKTDKDDKSDKPKRTRTRRGPKKADGEKNEASKEAEPKADKPTQRKRTRKVAERQPKAEGGITVETVTATGEKSVAKAEDGSVTKKFQRWWSKTTS